MKINELTTVQPSKIVVPALAKKLNQEVKEGFISAVEQATKYDFMLKVLTEAKNDIKQDVIGEIEKGETSKNGYSLKVQETGIKYDYSKCNDPVWNEYSKLLKEREKFLRSLPYVGQTIVDEETGDVTKIYPPNRQSSTSPIFTLQK